MIIENAKYYTSSLFPDDGNVGIKATINGVEYVTTDSTNGGNDFYAIMSGQDRVPKLVHIQY